MRALSTAELADLGARFGVPVGNAEADAVRETANGFLDSIDGLDELLPAADEPDTADRTWDAPADDPLNALAVGCDVPPPSGAGDSLAGLSVGVKDNVAVAGVPLGGGSAVLAGFVPSTDAAVVERLLDAGATITAMTTCDEFAGSARGTTPHDGPVRNPHDPDRTAGGSSGGSAVAVATGRVDAALGTDTGGSVRVPAAFCGVVGLKPTFGLVPLHGVIENTYTQDHVGPIAGSVRDVTRLLEVIAGPDDRDPASLQAAGRGDSRRGSYLDAVADPPLVSDLSLGVLEPGLGDGVASGIVERTVATTDRLADAGATITHVDVPGFEHGRAVKNALSVTELAAHWRAGGAPYRRGGVVDPDYQAELSRRVAERGDRLGPFYTAKLLAGAQVIDGQQGQPYTKAQAAREVLREQFEAALSGVDALVLPTTPGVAPRLDAMDDPPFDLARNTRAADVTRLPAVTVPNGTLDGLPVGLQLMGRAYDEAVLLGTAATVETVLAR